MYCVHLRASARVNARTHVYYQFAKVSAHAPWICEWIDERLRFRARRHVRRYGRRLLLLRRRRRRVCRRAVERKHTTCLRRAQRG